MGGSIAVLAASAVVLVYLLFFSLGRPRHWWKKPARQRQEEQILRTADNHAQIAGVLAGFSMAVVALATAHLSDPATGANLARAFVVAFFGFVCSATLFAMTAQETTALSHLFFTTASTLQYISIAVSFAGALVYLQMLDGAFLGGPALWTAVLGGFWAPCIALRDLHGLRRRTCLAVLFAALFGNALYRLIADGLKRGGFPMPATIHATMTFTIVVIGGLFLFGIGAALVRPDGLKKRGHRWATLFQLLGAMCAVLIAWSASAWRS